MALQVQELGQDSRASDLLCFAVPEPDPGLNPFGISRRFRFTCWHRLAGLIGGHIERCVARNPWAVVPWAGSDGSGRIATWHRISSEAHCGD